MALPVLNASPNYELTIPSTEEKVTFRPFLVKEQKVLLIANETNDKVQIVRAILNVLSSCINEQVDLYNLATFDIDYIFTQIRAKSVGEKVELNFKCSNCEEQNDVQVNLEEVYVDVKKTGKDLVVKLTEQISVKLKYPDYRTLMGADGIVKAETATDMMMEVILSSIDSIMTEEENIKAQDESREDLMAFVESMTAGQFEKISEFVQDMPSVQKDIEFDCTACGTKNKTVLHGIDDFF